MFAGELVKLFSAEGEISGLLTHVGNNTGKYAYAS